MSDTFGTIHMLCGKVCSGKSTYAQELHIKNHGIVLSCDDIMSSLFSKDGLEPYDVALSKCKQYLYTLAVQIASSNVDVILDFGFWSKSERDMVKKRFNNLGFDVRLHYVYADENTLIHNIEKRNSESGSHVVDMSALAMCNSMFEPPTFEELSR